MTVEEDTKIPNAATITLNKEDHTLANMLRSQLLLSSYVLFAGYKVPHPLEPAVVLKIQTDGTQTPIQAVKSACDGLILQLGQMKEQFEREVFAAKARGDGVDDGTGMDVEGGGGGGW